MLGTAASQAVLEVVEALIDRKPAAGLDQIHQALDAGSDPRQFARQMVDYFRDLLLVQTGNADQMDATVELRAQMARHSRAFSSSDLLRAIRLFNDAVNETRSAWQPALPLEMAFVAALGGAGGGGDTAAAESAANSSGEATKPAISAAPASTTAPAATPSRESDHESCLTPQPESGRSKRGCRAPNRPAIRPSAWFRRSGARWSARCASSARRRRAC